MLESRDFCGDTQSSYVLDSSKFVYYVNDKVRNLPGITELTVKAGQVLENFSSPHNMTKNAGTFIDSKAQRSSWIIQSTHYVYK